jgi:hypothetical protein
MKAGRNLKVAKSGQPQVLFESWRGTLFLFAAISIVFLAGCSGGSSSNNVIIVPTPTPAPTAPPTPVASATPTPSPSLAPSSSATPTPLPSPTPVPVVGNASVFAVDCTTQRAYVPLPFLGGDGNGEIAELDLSVDPDVSDPRIGTVSTGIPDLPVSAAADPVHGEILVASANENETGKILVIQEKDNSLVSFSFPAGSAPSPTDGVVYDAGLNKSLVSMSDAFFSCANPGACTGTALFDASTGAFADFNQLNPITNFAVDSQDQTALLNALAISPSTYALDLATNTACEFSDLNLAALDAEPDGVAADPSTGLWVFGNFQSSLATVVNLSEGTFSAPPNCMLKEGGTLPNSVNLDTGTGADMPGVAINPATHQALLTASVSNQAALLSLPTAAVHQLTSAMVTGVQSSLPDDPLGDPWESSTFPYAVVADSCHNFGYVLDLQRDFLVQIDLAKFQANPAAIKTALAGGHCAGTTTPFVCDNRNGVKFFPLPDVK